MIRYLVFIFLFLQGCTAASGDIFIIIKDQILGYSEPVIELADIEKSNYSFMTIKAGRGPYARMILNTNKNGTYEWISSNNERVYTFKGLVVRTVNLEHNFEIKDYASFDPLNPSVQSFKINLDNPKLFDTVLTLKVTPTGEADIDRIHGPILKYDLIKEIQSIGWKSRNTLWLTQNMDPIKSIQQTHPFYKKIQFNIYLK